jgi:hypothetical protein
VVGSLPDGVAISPDGTRVYIANRASNFISVGTARVSSEPGWQISLRHPHRFRPRLDHRHATIAPSQIRARGPGPVWHGPRPWRDHPLGRKLKVGKRTGDRHPNG